MQSIESVSHFAAKCRHRASLVMLACALHFYNERNRAFPAITDTLGKASVFVNHAFNHNQDFWSDEEHPTEIPGEVVERINQCYPIDLVEDDEGERNFSGYYKIIKPLANTYATCATNHAKMNFHIYQMKTIIDFIRSHGHKHPKKSCGELIKLIKRRINNLDAEEDDANDDMLDELVPDTGDGNTNGINAADVDDFIRFHRSFFEARDIYDAIDDDWIENDDNTGFIILYFVHLLTFQER